MNHLSQFENFLNENHKNVQELISEIQSVLSPDLLSPFWQDIVKKGDNHPTAGHCYAAAEALYHLIGGKRSHFIPQIARMNDEETHWWLQDKQGNILDPTAEQFYYKNETPPYENGRGTGFLTKIPSKRAQTIIDRVNSLENNL